MRFRHTTLVVLSGLLWLGIGVMLLFKGLHFVVGAGEECRLLNALALRLSSRDQAVVALIAVALFTGFLKGRYVMSKAIRKVVRRLVAMPEPVKLTQVYDQRYYILMAAMMGMGLLMNLAGIPSDIRGTIDVAIGSALMNGAMGYFRTAFLLKQGYESK